MVCQYLSSISHSTFVAKRMLSAFAEAGIPCTYILLPSIGAVMTEVNTIFLGAHSIHSNGAVYSRAGTALVAMLAKQHSVPVVVCCETYKYSDGVQLDSFTKNELGMFPSPITRSFTNLTTCQHHRVNASRTSPSQNRAKPSPCTTQPTSRFSILCTTSRPRQTSPPSSQKSASFPRTPSVPSPSP